MVKRRRTKASTVSKTKDNNKEKVVQASNSEETCSKNSNICEGDSPSGAKKPKLNASKSPENRQKYVPPFTASQRVSSRLRNMRKNSEKSKSSSQEANVLKDLVDEPKKEITPGKSEEESFAMVSTANEEKTDKMSPNAKQSDVEMKEDFEEKDSKRAEGNSSANISKTSPKQSGVEMQSVECTTNKFKGEKLQEIDHHCSQHDLQQVPKLSELAQRSQNRVETDGESKEEMKRSKLETSPVIVDEQMSDVADLMKTTELDIVQPEMGDVGVRVSNVESRISDFCARLGQVDARMEDVIGLQTLADTCADEEYIDVVTVDGNPSEISQRVTSNQLQEDDETETKRMHRKVEEDNKNIDNHSLNMDEEAMPNVISEQQPQQAVADVIIQSKPTTLCEENPTASVLKITLSDERGDKKTQDKPTNMSSPLCSQEIIKDKLSEILAIVAEEWHELRLSQTENNPIPENDDKRLEEPVKTSDTVTGSDTVINHDTNSQNTARVRNIEIQECETMLVEDQCYPAVAEKVKETENKQVFACDKNSQEANETESLETESLETEESKNLEEEKRINVQMGCDKDVHKNDQEVPSKVSTSPEQEVPQEMVTTTDILHDESKEMKRIEENVISNNSVEDQSYTEEFRELEELLPKDDMGLFDDVLLSKPQSISVNDDLPSGDGTIEFLINELNSLHCIVANYDRAVEDIKRQYKSSGRF